MTIKHLFLALALMASCAQNGTLPDESAGPGTIRIADLHRMSDSLGSRLLDDCRFVRLETNEHCLMGWPRKIRFADGLMIIMDNNNKIFVYQQDGTFVNSIGAIGKGPNELRSITNFYINEKEHYIGVMDPVGMRIVRHTFQGEPLKTFPLDKTVWGRVQDIDMTGDEHILITYRNSSHNPNQYAVARESDYTLLHYQLPFTTIGTSSCGMAYDETFAQAGGEWYAPGMICDTLYQFREGTLKPRWIIDFGLKHPDPEIIRSKEPYDCGYDPMAFLPKLGYSDGFQKVFPAGRFLYLMYLTQGVKLHIFLDPEKGTGFYFENQKNRNIFHSLDQFKTWNGSEMVAVIPVSDAMNDQAGEYALSHPKVLEVMRQCKEDDNPIIGFYKVPEPR